MNNQPLPQTLSLPTIYLRDLIVGYREFAALDITTAKAIIAQIEGITWSLPLRIPHFAYLEESPANPAVILFWHYDRWFASNEKLERDKALSAERIAHWEAEKKKEEEKKQKVSEIIMALKAERFGFSDERLEIFADRIYEGKLTLERIRQFVKEL